MPPSRLFWFRTVCLRLGGVTLGKDVSICGHGWIYGRGRLSVGNYSWFSPGVVVYTHIEAEVNIGERCDIGHGVRFICGSHEMGAGLRRAGQGTAQDIKVGDGCWIGAGAMVFGGVTIGNGAVVAAGAVVLHDVPANTLVAGVPAEAKKLFPAT